jgi:hypothetical protein
LIQTIKVIDISLMYHDYITHLIPQTNKYKNRRHMMIKKISILRLLNKYPKVNRFSLTTPYNEYKPIDKSFIIYHLEDSLSVQIMEQVMNSTLKHLRDYYHHFSNIEKEFFSSFETLIEIITEEVKTHLQVLNDKESSFESPYICDLFALGKTKFHQPKNLWHFYHEIEAIYSTYLETLNKMKKSDIKKDIMAIFNDPKYSFLKKSYLSHEIGFIWHCTQSSELAITYYFEINESTLRYLNQLKSIYDFRILEDLAFYEDKNLLVSTCTHEQFVNEF